MKRILFTLIALFISVIGFTQSPKRNVGYSGENENYKDVHGKYFGDYFIFKERLGEYGNGYGENIRILKNDQEIDVIKLKEYTGDETYFIQYYSIVQTIKINDSIVIDPNPTKFYFYNYLQLYEYDLQTQRVKKLPIKFEKDDLIVFEEVNKDEVILTKWRLIKRGLNIDRTNPKIIKIKVKDL